MTTPTDVVEIVARALWSQAQEGWPERIKQAWDSTDPCGNISMAIKREHQLGLARAALTALDAAGFAVVPKQPTKKMLAAGEMFKAPMNVWAAMLGVAPSHLKETGK